MKIVVLSILTHLIFSSVNAQSVYTLDGEVLRVKTGKVYLVTTDFESVYYGPNQISDSANIENGKFRIVRKVFDDHAYACRIVVKSDRLRGATDLVFLTAEDQHILIDSISEYISPEIVGSRLQEEMRFDYNPFFKGLVDEVEMLSKFEDSLYAVQKGEMPTEILADLEVRNKGLLMKSDSLFLNYSISHPNSYVTLWKLIERFNYRGYDISFENIFASLSDSIKKSATGKLFSKQLNRSSVLAVGHAFPNLKLKSMSRNAIKLSSKNLGGHFTLIDFWFANCSPCLGQFPAFSKLYAEYSNLGFEIIGISIDSEKDHNKWINVIKEKGLKWPQFLDESGKVTDRLGIRTFPTNYLVNQKGEILIQNISPLDLENYLKFSLMFHGTFDKLTLPEPE